VPLFARRRRPEPPLRLLLPRRNGVGWPDPGGRPSFAASTYLELGTRRAYEPQAHAVADLLVPAALPRLGLVADPVDEPYLLRTFTVAARIGAGIGLVDREQRAPGAGQGDDDLDPAIAGALLLARRGLPAMQDDWAGAGGWFLLAGHRLGRCGPDALPELLDVL
jgi:hypothetical protein